MKKSPIEEYIGYKKNFLKRVQFDPESENLCNQHFTKSNTLNCCSPAEHAPLEAVYIYFETATYDEIERDVKVKTLSEAPYTVLIRWVNIVIDDA